MTRRWLVGVVAAGFLLGACTTQPQPSPIPGGDGGGEGGTVEIFSWWTAGGEADGLEAMFEVFAQEYPQFEIENAAVAGGAGTEARAVLATRLSQGDPPESWQGHAGQELIGTYVAAGQIQPLNDLFEQEGWLDVMPPGLIEQISQDGNIYSVPVNIHRANVMWYVKSNLDEWGVEVPTNWADFLATAEELDAQGVTPLALGFQWTAMHLMETVLLGELRAVGYNALWDGSGDWSSAKVTAALETFGAVLEYTNEDASTIDWDGASQLVVDGDAAFQVMGDWAEGYYLAQGLEPNKSFNWASAPGTDGIFQWLSDSFVLPVGVGNEAGALAWLTVAGSQAGQDAFNPLTGSIPARNDGNRDLYDAYQRESMNHWNADTLSQRETGRGPVGSLTHGVVANDAWKAAIDTAIGLFLSDADVAAFQQALVDACAAEGPCG